MKKFTLAVLIVSLFAVISAVIYTNFLTGLIDSARAGNVKRLEVQLSRNKVKEKTYKALNQAIAYNRAKAVKVILNHIENPDYTANSYSPLVNAARQGNREIVKMLIDKGAKVYVSDNSPGSPLYHAVMYGRRDVVKLLLDNGADPNLNEIPIILGIPQYEDNLAEIARLLVLKGADPKGNLGKNAVEIAVLKKDYELLDMLIEKGAGVHLSASLDEAASNNDRQMVEYLIKSGAELKGEGGNAAFTHAYFRNNIDMMRYIIEKGVPVRNQKGYSILMTAVFHGRIDAAKVLLENGVDVNAGYKEGKSSPLFQAINNCDVEMVRLLLDYGALTKVKDQAGQNVFEALSLARSNRISWYDIGHKRDFDRILEMLKKADK
ncbi:MAG: ankyrin repeat domain-containing protein [Bacillota bacterium]